MNKTTNLKKYILQNQDIIRFVICVIACHFFWKITITHNEIDLSKFDIYWFGTDISTPFIAMTQHIAITIHWLFSLFEPNTTLENTRIIFQNGLSMNIVWACSGLKQMFIFSAIIICARGIWKHKLWFIPLGLFACHIYNILRITFLGWIVEYHFSLFDFFHEYITKYIFYGIIFLLWLWWNESFNKEK